MLALNRIYYICISIIVSLVLLLSYNSNSYAEDVPVPKFSQNVGAPTLKFLYWYVLHCIQMNLPNFNNISTVIHVVIVKCLINMSK